MAIAPIGTGMDALQMMQSLPQTQATKLAEVREVKSDFGTMLEGALTSVNDAQLDARNAVSDLASGQSVDLHGTMIRLEKAEITLRTMTSVRDRLITAYEQVMNMAL